MLDKDSITLVNTLSCSGGKSTYLNSTLYVHPSQVTGGRGDECNTEPERYDARVIPSSDGVIPVVVSGGGKARCEQKRDGDLGVGGIPVTLARSVLDEVNSRAEEDALDAKVTNILTNEDAMDSKYICTTHADARINTNDED